MQKKAKRKGEGEQGSGENVKKNVANSAEEKCKKKCEREKIMRRKCARKCGSDEREKWKRSNRK